MTFMDHLKVNRYLLLTCLFYAIAVMAGSFFADVDVKRYAAIAGVMLIQTIIMPAILFVFVVAVFFFKALLAGGRPVTIIRSVYIQSTAFLESARIQNGLAVWLAIAPLMTFFCIWKSLLPQFAFFQWDLIFSAMDRVIHGGAYPHEWIMLFLRSWNAERVFEYIYMIWFLVMLGVNVFAMFFDADATRSRQYIWSYVLCWILCGTALATIFYSVGPVYFVTFYPDIPNPYAGMMSWLSSIADGKPAFTLEAAQTLYQVAYDSRRPDINGISAMPSLHISMAWLMSLYAFKIRFAIGLLLALYTVAIMTASIVLGWHYAVDGYAGIILTSLIWAGVGWTVGYFRNFKGAKND